MVLLSAHVKGMGVLAEKSDTNTSLTEWCDLPGALNTHGCKPIILRCFEVG